MKSNRLRFLLMMLALSVLATLVGTLAAAGPAPQADKVATALRQFSANHPADGTLFVTWNTAAPTPKSIQSFKSPMGQGTPESVARQFLNNNRDLFLMKAQTPDLR